MSNVLKNWPLFKECLDALNTTLLPQEQSKELSKLFINLFPITKWGKIDWDKIERKIAVGDNLAEIIPSLEKLFGRSFDHSVYIEWNNAGLPIIQSDLETILTHFDDVYCVAFDKFIFNPQEGYVIEIIPLNPITVGIIEFQ